MKFLLYGANGYTGQLIIRFAKTYGLTPVIAGRSKEKIEPLAKEYGLDYKVFGLDQADLLDDALEAFDVVLHAAGPFMYTAKPMMEACLRTGTHYLDITGEILVFEMAARFDKAAREKGIVIMPGVGFDVVPTDCMALYLKNKMPDATHLKLGFVNIGGKLSHGTASTMTEGLGEGGAVRKNGKITKVPLGHKTMTVDFGDTKKFMMAIPWGDVSTAFFSTGIPNIETYTGIPPSSYKYVKLQRFLGPLLRSRLVKNFLKKRIKSGPAGPSDEMREKSYSLIYGEVQNSSGTIKKAKLKVPEGYTLTAHTALIITKAVLEGKVEAGHQTPAKAFGADLIMQLDDVERADM